MDTTTRKWIIGSTDRSQWHLGVARVSYDRAYLVTACKGKTLGGAWGANTWQGERPSEREYAVCATCDAIAQKQYCAPCRETGLTHCANPTECGELDGIR